MAKKTSTSHRPTKATRELVLRHVMVGTSQGILCELLGISINTLYKYYRSELDHGMAEANSKIARKLYDRAIDGEISAIIFWLKSRAHWREKHSLEVTGADGEDLFAAFREAVMRKPE